MGAGNNRRIGIEYTADDGGGYRYAACVSSNAGTDVHKFVPLCDVYESVLAIPTEVHEQFRRFVAGATVLPPIPGDDNSITDYFALLSVNVWGITIATALQAMFTDPVDVAGLYRVLWAQRLIAQKYGDLVLS